MSVPVDKVPFGYRTVTAADKKRLVQEQFNPIAATYDRADALLSLGLHFLWKRATVRALRLRPGDRVLDVCGGTADLALRAARRVGPEGQVVVCDINRPMMETGQTKARGARNGTLVAFVQGDAERLPFPDRSFDAVTVGFGLRNLVDLDQGLREIGRILRPGGRFAGLEFTLPRHRWQRSLYAFYSFRVMLPAARLITGTEGPFRYLAESIRVFAEVSDIPGGLRRAGLATIAVRPLSLGIATIYSGLKP
jgi:demethylmenaquinone methyltransferase/2-methoxy-6-polyprenyl-1,4-benzoquinol methylase